MKYQNSDKNMKLDCEKWTSKLRDLLRSWRIFAKEWRHPIQTYRMWSFTRKWDYLIEQSFSQYKMPEPQEGTRKWPVYETPSEKKVWSADGWAEAGSERMFGRLSELAEEHRDEPKNNP